MAGCPRAVVLHGATADRPDEADTVAQAETVADALAGLGWECSIETVGLDLSALDGLLMPRPDIVFNLVEAIAGDGRLAHLAPAVLDHLAIRYTGAPAATLFTTTRKTLAKTLLCGAGLPTPDWIESGKAAAPGQPHCERMIVKSVSEDASIGIDAASVVSPERVSAEMAARMARHGGEWFAEAYIDGREFNVGILDGEDGPEVLPIAEILFVDYPAGRPRIVDYDAKWLEGSFAFTHTPRHFNHPRSDDALLKELRRLALETWALFSMTGYGRVDFRVDAEGRPWILEVNANPCLTPDAGFMAAAGRAGYTAADVVGRIAAAALRGAARNAA